MAEPVESVTLMATSSVGGMLQPSQRVLATHPACPLSLKHEGAWKHHNYKSEAMLGSNGGAEQQLAKCAQCGAAVSMLVYDTVSLHCCLSHQRAIAESQTPTCLHLV